MKKIKTLILGLALVLGVGALFLSAPSVEAANAIGEACAADPSATICQNQDDNIGAVIKTVINVLLFIIGALAVIMIIVGGLRYTTSAGNATAVTGAKNTILYAVIGLVVALLALAIVNFVFDSFGASGTTTLP